MSCRSLTCVSDTLVIVVCGGWGGWLLLLKLIAVHYGGNDNTYGDIQLEEINC